MSEPADSDVLRVQLDLQLSRQPVRGRLRTECGADERFEGWLGFVDALKRAHPNPNGASMATTLITGGTGKTGRRIVERLQAREATVRVGSRSGAPAFDWEDRATWAAALDGVDAAYIAYYPDIAAPGGAETVAAFAEQARAAGARRLVLLSGRGEPEAQRAERLVQAAAPQCTVVRCSWFNQNFDESFLLDPVLSGTVALPAGDVREPFVDADDIADVAVAALTEDGHAGRLYELTGPRMLTFAEAVSTIAEAAGRPIEYVQISFDDFAAGLTAAGVPDDVLGLMRMLFVEVLDGRNESLADGVQQALGRPARDFADYARATAATGAWDV